MEFKSNSTNSKPGTSLQLQVIKISHEMPEWLIYQYNYSSHTITTNAFFNMLLLS